MFVYLLLVQLSGNHQVQQLISLALPQPHQGSHIKKNNGKEKDLPPRIHVYKINYKINFNYQFEVCFFSNFSFCAIIAEIQANLSTPIKYTLQLEASWLKPVPLKKKKNDFPKNLQLFSAFV